LNSVQALEKASEDAIRAEQKDGMLCINPGRTEIEQAPGNRKSIKLRHEDMMPGQRLLSRHFFKN